MAKLYIDNLDDRFIKPVINEDYYDVYHILNIRHKKRDELQKYLLENGVKAEIHYPVAPHKQKAYRDILQGDYPISQEIHETTLSLPISYFHTKDDVLKVVELMNGWLK